MPANDSLAHELFTNTWKLILLRSAVLLVLGIIFLARPDVPLTMAILVMGVYWFVDGILTVVRSLKARHTIGYWGFGVAVGVIGILAGLLVFSRPVATTQLTTTVLVTILAIAAMISGLTNLATGVRMRKSGDSGFYLIIGGAISLLFGILLVTSPMYSILVLVRSLGVIAVIVGVVLLFEALRIRKMEAKMIPANRDEPGEPG